MFIFLKFHNFQHQFMTVLMVNGYEIFQQNQNYRTKNHR